MINQSKPASGQSQSDLLIGSGFKLLIGSGFNLIINPENLLAGLTNLVRPSRGQTWGGITTTWATETDTWLNVSQLINNTSKPTGSITNVSKPA